MSQADALAVSHHLKETDPSELRILTRKLSGLGLHKEARKAHSRYRSLVAKDQTGYFGKVKAHRRFHGEIERTHVDARDVSFEADLDYVLRKNHRLYQRLAQ